MTPLPESQGRYLDPLPKKEKLDAKEAKTKMEVKAMLLIRDPKVAKAKAAESIITNLEVISRSQATREMSNKKSIKKVRVVASSDTVRTLTLTLTLIGRSV